MAGNSRALYEYKQKVMALILNTPTITDALDSGLDVSDLPYSNIFPHGFIPGTDVEAKCYITLEVSMPQVSTVNYFFKDVLLTITVICHNDMMRTDYGTTRTDFISVELDKLLNGNIDMGVGEMELVSNVEGVFTPKHTCRTMRFKTKEVNKSYCDDNAIW